MSTQRRFSPEKPTKHSLLMSHYLPPANPSFASLNLLQRVCPCVRFAVFQVLNVLQSPHVKGLVSECQLCWEMSLKWDLAGENQVTGDHSLEEDTAVSIPHPLSPCFLVTMRWLYFLYHVFSLCSNVLCASSKQHGVTIDGGLGNCEPKQILVL